jgi:hypothetical protein
MLFDASHRAHRAQYAHRHWQIEARAFLAYVGRREVNGNGVVGIAEAGVHERALDALPAFTHSGVGHADGDEIARRAGLVHVDFDIDQMSIDAVYGGAASLEQRHSVSLARKPV